MIKLQLQTNLSASVLNTRQIQPHLHHQSLQSRIKCFGLAKVEESNALKMDLFVGANLILSQTGAEQKTTLYTLIIEDQNMIEEA